MDEQIKIEKRRAYDREWKRQYKFKNLDKVREKARKLYHKQKQNPEWLEKHKEYMRQYRRKWRRTNPDYPRKHREQVLKWYRKNAKQIYQRRRAKLHEKIASAIRARVNECLRLGYKSVKTEVLLGITFKELKIYLEKKFDIGMTWENYGQWHVDHIKPLASFDLTNLKEQKKAFHYTNLQPLWAKDNLHKYTKYSN